MCIGHRLQYNLDDPGPGQEDALTLLFLYISSYIYTSLHIHMYIYIYIYICTYVYIYTHEDALTLLFSAIVKGKDARIVIGIVIEIKIIIVIVIVVVLLLIIIVMVETRKFPCTVFARIRRLRKSPRFGYFTCRSRQIFAIPRNTSTTNAQKRVKSWLAEFPSWNTADVANDDISLCRTCLQSSACAVY